MKRFYPQTFRVVGVVYDLEIFQVLSRDEQGRPENIKLVPKDTTDPPIQDDVYLLAYVPRV